MKGDFNLSFENKLALLEPKIQEIIEILDPTPDRSGVKETPNRVAKAWLYWTEGYTVDPETLLKQFDDGGEEYDEYVCLRNIPFHSHCEHHHAPFFGHATIAYIPDKKIVGISKLARVLDAYARRFQVQERITVQVANTLQSALAPKGVAVHLTAEHMCMSSRGVRTHGTQTVTTKFHGAFKDDHMVRAEFLASIK